MQPVTPDFMFSLYEPGYLIYDIETYPNVFSIGITHDKTGQRWLFEISDWKNDTQLLCMFLERASFLKCEMVGYNNIGFDYPVIHFIYKNRYVGISCLDIYNKAMSIIGAHGPARFAHMVWESDWIVNQVDLFKIHHFDNISKSTSLKVLEFNMRMLSVEDLPFPVGTVLNYEQRTMLIDYMWHDIDATKDFLAHTSEQIQLRRELSAEFDTNMMNMSDVKMGEVILVHEMQQAGIQTHEYQGNKKVKRQTKRESVNLGEVILSYINFETPELQQIREYLANKVITETKGTFTDLKVNLDGVDFKFGTGGLHGSVESQVVHTTDTHQIIDVDVASYYPNLGIVNEFYPEHLGVEFCSAYNGIYEKRKQTKKGSARNGAFKLALNGAYGGSNNEYSPFYDPKYTMSITINGQLLLCVLIEQMLKVPGLKMIQANTDGITYSCPHAYIEHTRNVCRWWEQLTGLELEEVLYNRMFIRDVNNYMAEKMDGKIKRIGAYAYESAIENPGTREMPFHKDWSARIVAKAAEAALVHGTDIKEFITNHHDLYDFMLRTKVPRSSILEWGGTKVDNIVRYYISVDGRELEKVMPPNGPLGQYKRANKLTDSFVNEVMAEIGPGVWDERIHTKNKSVYEERRSGFHTGWKVQLCNRLPQFVCDPDFIDFMGNDIADIADVEAWCEDINYLWYIKEAEKLVKPLLG
jgi:hypothetical protein